MAKQSSALAVAPPGTCPMGPAAVTFAEARAALMEASAKVPGLLAQVKDPTAPALGGWNIAELATHMSHGWAVMPHLLARDLDAVRAAMPALPNRELGTASGALLPTLDHLSAATVEAVAADPERDLGVLAERIRAGAAAFAAVDGESDPSYRPWMADGILAPPSLFACHLLLETVMHSHDLARAAGLKHVTENRHAAVVMRGFMLPMLVNLTRGAPGPRFAMDMRLAGDRRLVLVYTGNGVAYEEPGRRPVDSRLWIHPAALLLLMWKRRSLASVVAARQSLVWGRKPWTALTPLGAVPSV
jgi:hypothetical protein